MAILDRDRKILWGRAGNRCAICQRPLVDDALHAEDPLAVTGVECHIVARSDGGPRAGEIDASLIDRYENLILLCGADHKRADDQPAHFTADHLRALKGKHEDWVRDRLDVKGALPRARWIVPKGQEVELALAADGTTLLRQITKVLACEFDHPDPQSEEEAELIGSLLQNLADFGDIWDDIGPAAQVQERFRMTERLHELLLAGLAVYVGEYVQYLQVDGHRQPWPVAVVKIARLPDTAAE